MLKTCSCCRKKSPFRQPTCNCLKLAGPIYGKM